jgi:hypothetical protein
LRDLRTSLENAGIEFWDDVATGIGVKLQPGMMEPTHQDNAKKSSSSTTPSTAKRAIDYMGESDVDFEVPIKFPDDPDLQGLYDYWRERPNEWQELSDPVRRAVLHEIFGATPEGDPITEAREGL